MSDLITPTDDLTAEQLAAEDEAVRADSATAGDTYTVLTPYGDVQVHFPDASAGCSLTGAGSACEFLEFSMNRATNAQGLSLTLDACEPSDLLGFVARPGTGLLVKQPAGAAAMDRDDPAQIDPDAEPAIESGVPVADQVVMDSADQPVGSIAAVLQGHGLVGKPSDDIPGALHDLRVMMDGASVLAENYRAIGRDDLALRHADEAKSYADAIDALQERMGPAESQEPGTRAASTSGVQALMDSVTEADDTQALGDAVEAARKVVGDHPWLERMDACGDLGAAMVTLQIALDVVRTNEPIHRAEGNTEQADLEVQSAGSFERAIGILSKAARTRLDSVMTGYFRGNQHTPGAQASLAAMVASRIAKRSVGADPIEASRTALMAHHVHLAAAESCQTEKTKAFHLSMADQLRLQAEPPAAAVDQGPATDKLDDARLPAAAVQQGEMTNVFKPGDKVVSTMSQQDGVVMVQRGYLVWLRGKPRPEHANHLKLASGAKPERRPLTAEEMRLDDVTSDFRQHLHARIAEAQGALAKLAAAQTLMDSIPEEAPDEQVQAPAGDTVPDASAEAAAASSEPEAAAQDGAEPVVIADDAGSAGAGAGSVEADGVTAASAVMGEETAAVHGAEEPAAPAVVLADSASDGVADVAAPPVDEEKMREDSATLDRILAGQTDMFDPELGLVLDGLFEAYADVPEMQAKAVAASEAWANFLAPKA